MADLQFSGPWGTTDGDAGPFFQSDWRRLFARDGVVNDTTGGSFAATATGSNTVVSVATGQAVVQGHLGVGSSIQTFDLATAGTQPTSGQTRIDRIVLRLDPTLKTINMTLLTGTPAASGAVPPSLTRVATGAWDMPLARITRVGPVAVTQAMIVDERPHTGWHYGPLTDTGSLPSDAPIGSTATVGTDFHEKRAAGWWNVTNPAWTTLTLASGIISASAPIRARVAGGHVELRGQVSRTGLAAWALGWTGTLFTLPAGFRPAELVRREVSRGGQIGSGGPLEISTAGVVRAYIPEAGTTAVFIHGIRFPI